MLISGVAECGEGAECETGDGGRRLVASEPVEQSGKGSQRRVDGRVAQVVHVADRQTEVIERGCESPYSASMRPSVSAICVSFNRSPLS